jgi:hypothetical protein
MYSAITTYFYLFEKFLPSPSKIIVFSWQALLGRLPTRLNLLHGGIIQQSGAPLCALCDRSLESETHLFVHPIATKVWNNIHAWFDFVSVSPDTFFFTF